MDTARAFLLLTASLVTLVSTAGGARAQNPVSYSRDMDAVVIRYREILPILGPDTGPTLTVYGDGHVSVHYPAFMQLSGDYEGRLTAGGLDALVRSMARTHRLTKFDANQAKSKRRRAREASTAATGIDTVVADAGTIEIELHCDGVDKYISWAGLRFDAERYPSVAAIQDLRAAQRQLRALMRSEELRKVR
jgi:hypothetical protein